MAVILRAFSFEACSVLASATNYAYYALFGLIVARILTGRFPTYPSNSLLQAVVRWEKEA